MTDEPYYVLNRNEGVDTLHRNPREECQTDDATGRTVIDSRTGAALEASGDVHLCKHCIDTTPEEPAP